jgi:hypothetical protein
VLQNSVIKPPFSSTLATYFYAFWDKFGLNHALHPYRLQVMVHRHLVRNDIDTISKTAYNHRIQKAPNPLSISGKTLCRKM